MVVFVIIFWHNYIDQSYNTINGCIAICIFRIICTEYSIAFKIRSMIITKLYYIVIRLYVKLIQQFKKSHIFKK